jgi:hypothetical protein
MSYISKDELEYQFFTCFLTFSIFVYSLNIRRVRENCWRQDCASQFRLGWTSSSYCLSLQSAVVVRMSHHDQLTIDRISKMVLKRFPV